MTTSRFYPYNGLEEVIRKMKGLPMIAGWLLILGGLNAGLAALLNFDLLGTVLGTGTISQVVYILIGAAAVFMAYNMLTAKKGKK